MGKICYLCKKELKWHMIKITYEELVNGMRFSGKRIPPTGMTTEDRLCNDCHNKLSKPGSEQKIKQRSALVQNYIDTQRAENQKAYQKASSPIEKCYWCTNNQHITSKENWIFENHPQCFDCSKIIVRLTSTKLQELFSLEKNHYDKIALLQELYNKAWRASSRAGQRKYLDIFSGADGGLIGSVAPNSDTQNLENVANQNKGSLELKLMDAKQETIRIKNLIKNEKIHLAKKHFFNSETNEFEKKNSTKLKEFENPIKILKIRLEKGEINLEEFNKIKENLERNEIIIRISF